LRVAQGRFVHLFINGQSWGIYRLSERVERFFLEDNYGIRNADLVQDGRQREGSDEEWEALVDWVKAHELADPANYAYLQTRLDLDNFTDFAALYLYFGFSSEELYAVRPRGGRWTFIWGGGSQSYAQRADSAVAALLAADTDFALLLRQLLENRQYRGRFVGRLADLLNTICSERPMQQRVERLSGDLAADMQYETARWPAPLPWENNISALQSFAVERPAAVRQQLAELLELPGTVRIRLNVSPSESGELFVNGASTRAAEWAGDFFPGMVIDAVAIPAPGYVFAGWEREEELPEETFTEITFTVESPITAVAHFEPEPDDRRTLRPDDVVINEYWINDNGTHYASLQQRPLEGDWLELWVRRPDFVDLRGWRITDNDTKTGRDEGSIILPQLKSLAAVPRDTVLLIIVSQNTLNDTYFPVDDLDAADGRLLFYLGNGNLDVTTDPGFAIGAGDDNLVLLAPGPSGDFADDIGVDFIAEGRSVTPYTFGVLSAGVRFERPFRRLGGDDGAFFTRRTGNDSLVDWEVDPPAYQSGDVLRLDASNVVTPGELNPRQRFPSRWLAGWLGRLIQR
ncbi:MAG: CotH kinase family protein, partial [Chloroflexota bacterium]|nr:CotH kinase family protein [Chloroflexota bacterium]